MKTPKIPLNCFIATLVRVPKDPYLRSHGLTADLAIFSIPSYGILNKSLVVGSVIDLEFLSFFSLLEHISTALKSEKIKNVQILSSNAEFVLSFTGRLPHLIENKERKKLLVKYSSKLEISVGLVETFKNQAYLPLTVFPSVPADKKDFIKKSMLPARPAEFKRLQKGVIL